MGEKNSLYLVLGIVFLLLATPMTLLADSSSFSDLEESFVRNTSFVTAESGNSMDLLARDTVSKTFQSQGLLYGVSDDKSAPKDRNLVLIGGPEVNSLTKEYNDIFGIKYEENEDTVFITVDGTSVSRKKLSTTEDIGIVYIGKANNKSILMLWGGAREGTFAAGLVMGNSGNWQKYGNSEYLLLRWNDSNGDSFVQESEILVTSQSPATAVTTDDGKDQDQVTVTITADFGEGYSKEWKDVKVSKGATVFDAMKASGMQFDYNIQSFGAFITSIEGLGENRSTGKYWQYWVNGNYAQLGVSNQKVSDGMTIEWRYTDAFFS